MSDILAEKSALRASLRKTRREFVRNLPDAAKQVCFSMLPNPLTALFDKAEVIGSYSAIGSEADPKGYHTLWHEKGKTIALPWFNAEDLLMQFRQWQPEQPLEKGPFGIMQPLPSAPRVTPDLLLIPLLGFDDQGNRLGQGGGHYDRYCARHPDALRIGLAWSVQQCDVLHTEKHDKRLDMIITQAGLITPQASRLASETAEL